MESHQQEMIERMTSLLPVDRQQISRNILPRREAFEVLYHLHCDNLCSDFQVASAFPVSQKKKNETKVLFGFPVSQIETDKIIIAF